MWPFKKEVFEQDPTEDAIAELKAFRDIGETFNYLGRTCVVTGHTEFDIDIGIYPLLQFNYCDDHGVIRTMTARVSDLPALLNQQTEGIGKGD